ncbi:MAG: hypothetical protein R2909_22645 [Gemmatimonadales bacterium]
MVPDISEEIHRVEQDPDLSIEEKRTIRTQIETDYAAKSEKLHIIHKLLQAHRALREGRRLHHQDNQVLIVDEYTGRVLPGRRAGRTASTRRWK